MNIETIAQAAHDANAVLCRALGDDSQPPWSGAPYWQKDSAINGVNLHVADPETTPQQSHESWLREKYADGWAYGKTKDPAFKLHPCMVPYEELPAEQQAKDALFGTIMHALVPLL